MAPSASESTAHFNLKRAALLWAQQNRFSVAAWEVRVPLSPYRADVAAYRPEAGPEQIGVSAIFECKQARSDFLKDHHELTGNLARLRDLQQRRAVLERLLAVHHPTLRCGDSLFPEFESVDLAAISHAGYRSVCRETALVERRIFGKSKLHRMAKWKCANLLYLVLPAGLAAPEELPGTWGVLVPPADWDLRDPSGPCAPLELLRAPQWLDAAAGARLAMLQRIAGRATAMTNQSAGLDWVQPGDGRWRGEGPAGTQRGPRVAPGPSNHVSVPNPTPVEQDSAAQRQRQELP